MTLTWMLVFPNIMDEFFPIPGYEGFYEINRKGVVRSTSRIVMRSDGRKRTIYGQTLKTYLSTTGYPTVRLNKLDGGKHKTLHKLLAITFIPNPNGLPFVRHLNDVKTDYSLTNLAWGTQSDNMLDSIQNGTHQSQTRETCPKGHKIESPGPCLECRRQRGREYMKRRRAK